jgi:hypothetical protein
MSVKRVHIGKLDALGIGVLAVLIRWGGPALGLGLQFLGVAAGVGCLVAAALQKTWTAILLAPAAWIFWRVGLRLQFVLAAKPLDRAARLTTPEN